MKFIQGEDREQTTIFCLDQAVSQDNEVRLIDLFVHAIKLSEYGFKTDFIDNGRPAYHPADLLKLFIYVMTKKTIKHASADVGLIFTSYNLRRIFNLVGENQLKKYLRALGVLFLVLSSYLKAFCGTFKEQLCYRTFS